MHGVAHVHDRARLKEDVHPVGRDVARACMPAGLARLIPLEGIDEHDRHAVPR